MQVGTNNAELRRSDLYLGHPHERCNDDDYFKLMDEFMNAVYTRWPKVLVQFEDFQNERAVALLSKYRSDRLCFNDDIQGTGAVTVAGVLCALRAIGLNVGDLVRQKIVIVGAGSAGIGIDMYLCVIHFRIIVVYDFVRKFTALSFITFN